MKLWNQNHQIIFHRLNILSEFNQFVIGNGHCVTKSVGLFLERDAEWAFLECQHRLLKLFDGNLRVLCLCLDTYYVTKTTLHTFECTIPLNVGQIIQYFDSTRYPFQLSIKSVSIALSYLK